MENEREIVAEALKQLLKRAAEMPGRGPASIKGLADAINAIEEGNGKRDALNRRTIQRAVKAQTPLQIDNLGKIARAYNLLAWQLLVPEFDPAEPPKVLSPAERKQVAIWRSSHEVLEEQKRGSRSKPSARNGDTAASANPRRKPRKKRTSSKAVPSYAVPQVRRQRLPVGSLQPSPAPS